MCVHMLPQLSFLHLLSTFVLPRELLEAGSYDGDEYLNYPSFNILNPEDRSPYNEDLDYNPSAMDYQYLEEVMDNALLVSP